MKNDGHQDKFGPPKSGWPTFGPDGKRIRETPKTPARKAKNGGTK